MTSKVLWKNYCRAKNGKKIAIMNDTIGSVVCTLRGNLISIDQAPQACSGVATLFEKYKNLCTFFQILP